MEEPINPVFPVVKVTSLDELMDIAASMEYEAGQRFEQLATEMERLGNHDTATLFRTLADEEREHESQITDWAAREQRRPPEHVRFRWRMPETFEPGEAEHSIYTMTPYEALSIAVRNEERAFAFYSYLAAIAKKDSIRKRAEDLAKGELDHVARLRLRRRHAYRAEFGHSRVRPSASSAEELHALAAGLEASRADLDEKLADMLDNAGDDASASLLRDIARQTRAQLEELKGRGAIGAGEATETATAAAAAGVLDSGSLTRVGAVRLALKNAEEIFQIYADIAEHAGNEPLLWEAQSLAEQAVSRLALISALVQTFPDEPASGGDG